MAKDKQKEAKEKRVFLKPRESTQLTNIHGQVCGVEVVIL